MYGVTFLDLGGWLLLDWLLLSWLLLDWFGGLLRGWGTLYSCDRLCSGSLLLLVFLSHHPKLNLFFHWSLTLGSRLISFLLLVTENLETYLRLSSALDTVPLIKYYNRSSVRLS